MKRKRSKSFPHFDVTQGHNALSRVRDSSLLWLRDVVELALIDFLTPGFHRSSSSMRCRRTLFDGSLNWC